MTYKNINILSIDASCKYNTVVMLYNNKIYYQRDKCNNNHEKNILTMIKNLLLSHCTEIQDFKIISFVTGPGSFTGIRLSASIAQGLSISNNINLIGISSLQVQAEQAWRLYKIQRIIICNIANKKKIYWAKYIKNEKNHWIGQELLLNIDEVLQKINLLKKKWYITGSGNIHFQTIHSPFLKYIHIDQSHAQDLITLTMIEEKKNNFLSIENIKLNYLNNPIY